MIIAVNPFKALPIYGDDYVNKFRGRSAFDPKLEPHMCVNEMVIVVCGNTNVFSFALADNVFSDMKFRGENQVVIISGESGAPLLAITYVLSY